MSTYKRGAEARLRAESPLDDHWIVSDPDELIATVDTLLKETATAAESVTP